MLNHNSQGMKSKTKSGGKKKPCLDCGGKIKKK